ncbi:zwei Ig domain protein zig-8-like [Condylostylus longicornis]|uniref:zwei Ig domain protein zig-8-like n=1 Tax=Condylostylus longicornis TaxID=2530218 RepID=UPI00244E33E4|nr:zwei Ig domain protein zig-8-like [Condylostylus longicornis]
MKNLMEFKQFLLIFNFYSIYLQYYIVGVRSISSYVSNSVIDKPYFDDVSPRNITSVVDETAILKCRVKNKGNRTVSWMRKRDLHILTTNIYTYTGDQRFSVIHTPGSEDWDLKIEYAQLRDSGIYECQVNTEPKINLGISLDVVTAIPDPRDVYSQPRFYDVKAARAKILGSTEVFVKKDSTISLGCTVNIHANSVLWYHNDHVVDFNSIRGGISLETEKTDSGTTSRLLLTRASLKDSGNYSCVPTMAIPASVQVHVLNGEHPAAMQTGGGCGKNCLHSKSFYWNIIVILYILGNIHLIIINSGII